MRTLKKTATFAAAMLMISTLAFGAGRNEATARLKETRNDLAAKANGQKGYPRAVLDQERLRLDNLIDDLEAGKRVDPQDVDNALKRANRVGR